MAWESRPGTKAKYYYRAETHAGRLVKVYVGTGEEARLAAEADAAMTAIAWRAASAGGREDLTLLLGDVGLFATSTPSRKVSGAIAYRSEVTRSDTPARSGGDANEGRVGGGLMDEFEHRAQVDHRWLRQECGGPNVLSGD